MDELGISPRLYAKLEGYVASGKIEFEGGYLKKLNLDQWSPADAEEFIGVLNLSMHKQVQRAMAGETGLIFHKDGLASLFLHLKSFPLLAMTKQSARHARIADPEAIATLTYALMTAGAVYTAKQVINGNEQNLDPVQIMKGAFGMSNLTGWFPMFSDPLASMLGMDSLKFNEYSRGIDGNVVGTPPAFTTLNKMANIPGALASPVTGAFGLSAGMTSSDVTALKATPILGNLYGFTAIFNTMRDAVKKQPAQRSVADPPATPVTLGQKSALEQAIAYAQ
jgi:hypothetical protein